MAGGITLKKNLITPMTSGNTTMEEERRVVDNVLKAKVATKESPLLRLSGVKTPVTYLAQITQSANDYLVNLNSFNDIDPNMVQLKKIENMVLLFKSEMTPDVQTDPVMGVSVESNGTCIVMPRTIKPRQGDVFVMKNYDRTNLYRVSLVTPTTLENDAGFEINFVMIFDNFNIETHPIRNCIVEEWNFEFRHVGTEFRTLFRREEYDYLKGMRGLYAELSETFIGKFYDKTLNTFFFEVEDNATHEDVPYTIVSQNPEQDMTAIVNSADNRTGPEWFGRKFYEREVIEFIKKHNIFYSNKRVILPTQFFASRKVYRDTIYGAIEARDHKRLKYRYFIPTALTMATPGFPPQLFGKVDLMWSPSLTDGCLNLFPKSFADKIKILPNSARQSYTDNFYQSYTDFVVELVAIYVNGRQQDDWNVVSRLKFLWENIRRIEEMHNEDMFFLLPLVGYILTDIMIRFSSEEFTKLMNQTEATTDQQ